MRRNGTLLLTLFLLFVFPMLMQAQASNHFIHVCVIPTILNSAQDAESSNVGEPYLITFRDADLFGLVVPHPANMVIYADTRVSAALYTISPDVPTGGYHTVERLAQVSTGNQVPIQRGCGELYRDIISDNLVSTVPLPVSLNHAVVIQNGGDDKLADPFIGVMGISYGASPGPRRGFQIIQLTQTGTLSASGSVLDIKLHFLAPATPFNVITNTNFGLSVSNPNSDKDFPPPTFAANREYLRSELSSLYTLDLFSVMRDTKLRIYPRGGLNSNYLGGYIRLSMTRDPQLLVREPAFAAGDIVKSIEGAEAQYFRFQKSDSVEPRIFNFQNPAEVLGSLKVTGTAEVVEIDAVTGQLIVRNPSGEGAVVIESWLVEK